MKSLYALLLYLFPRTYREEYGEELQAVFNLSMDDASAKGGFEAMSVTLRELRGLPYAILHAHLRERRKAKMAGKFASRFDFEPGSGKETFAALTPFLFSMAMVLFGYLARHWIAPIWASIAFVILFWSAVLGLFLLGSAKGLPRWFLPYLGVLLAIASLLFFNFLVNLRLDVWWHRSSGWGDDFNFGNFLWIGLILLVFLLLAISRSVPRFRPFYQRLRDDWPLLSFLLYGTIPMILWLNFDDYVNEEPFFALSILMLTLGGWFYLRKDKPLNRFMSLQIGLGLSMVTAAAGKAALILWSRSQELDFILTDELVFTLETWLWLAAILSLPYLFRLLPRAELPSQTV
ncbi:MAG: hypothetical protein HXY35_14020 [Chloroflexi bacterium]|nr:hypothetical protein [Chloroflexota bacterium]